MRRLLAVLAFAALALCTPTWGLAQEGPFTIERLSEPPPTTVADAIKSELNTAGYRIIGAGGKPFADIWLRKAVPATAKYEGPKGEVLFPVLAAGELLGVIRYTASGQDYRDQPIEPGVYTLRYGLRRIDGNHQGTSPFRDFGLLLPLAKDQKPAALTVKDLEKLSAEAVGSNHPAVLMIVTAPEGQAPPAIHRDEDNNLWGAVLALPLSINGGAAPAMLPIQLIVVGIAPA